MKPLPKRSPQDQSTAPHPASSMDHALRHGRFPGKRTWLLVCLVALLVVAVYTWPTSERSLRISSERISHGKVARTAFAEYAPVNGTLVPAETVFLAAVQGGRVATVHVEAGELVAFGDPIVALVNVDLELQVIAGEATYSEQLGSLARAEIGFDQQGLQYERDLLDAQLELDLTHAALNRRLPREVTGVPQAEIDRLRTQLAYQEKVFLLLTTAQNRDHKNMQGNLDQLRASGSRLEESLVLLRRTLEDLSITAPIPGRLSSFDVRVGQVIAPGERIGQVDRIGEYQIRALVDEFYLGRLMTGQAAVVLIGAAEYALTIRKVYPEVEQRLFAVDLIFDGNLPPDLRSGQSMRVRIGLSASEETMTVPNGPYFEQTGGLWVYVVAQDGRSARRREVQLGRRNLNQVEVLSGVNDGESIITSSYEGFSNAEHIQLIQP